MYKVLRLFADLQDGEHIYKPGDTFPRKGVKVSEERLAELSSNQNLQKMPLIKAVAEKAKKTADK